jgi:hypothetical protein
VGTGGAVMRSPQSLRPITHQYYITTHAAVCCCAAGCDWPSILQFGAYLNALQQQAATSHTQQGRATPASHCCFPDSTTGLIHHALVIEVLLYTAVHYFLSKSLELQPAVTYICTCMQCIDRYATLQAVLCITCYTYAIDTLVVTTSSCS